MKPSAYLPAIAVRTMPARVAMLLKRLGMLALALAAWGVSAVHADATLTYELSGSESGKTVKRFSIARFFVRIDDPAEAERYLLFQAGKFFPVYAVDTAGQTYTRLTPAVTPRLGPLSRSEPVADDSPDQDDDHAEHEDDDENTRRAESAPQNAAEDAARAESQEASSQPPAQQPGADSAVSPPPTAEPTSSEAAAAASARAGRGPAVTLKPTKKTRSIAGIQCRVVRELLDGEPIMEHCMANSARLGISDRELITLARLFAMSRNMDFDWLGVGTADEEFVAVQSRDLRDNRLLQLTSVSTQPLPAGYLRIPRTMKLKESEAQSDAGPAPAASD